MKVDELKTINKITLHPFLYVHVKTIFMVSVSFIRHAKNMLELNDSLHDFLHSKVPPGDWVLGFQVFLKCPLFSKFFLKIH